MRDCLSLVWGTADNNSSRPRYPPYMAMCRDITVVLLWCCGGVTVVLLWCYCEATVRSVYSHWYWCDICVPCYDICVPWCDIYVPCCDIHVTYCDICVPCCNDTLFEDRCSRTIVLHFSRTIVRGRLRCNSGRPRYPPYMAMSCDTTVVLLWCYCEAVVRSVYSHWYCCDICVPCCDIRVSWCDICVPCCDIRVPCCDICVPCCNDTLFWPLRTHT